MTPDLITEYCKLVTDLGFAIGTGVVVVSSFIIGYFSLQKAVVNTIQNKLNKLEDNLGEVLEKVSEYQGIIKQQGETSSAMLGIIETALSKALNGKYRDRLEGS